MPWTLRTITPPGIADRHAPTGDRAKAIATEISKGLWPEAIRFQIDGPTGEPWQWGERGPGMSRIAWTDGSMPESTKGGERP